MPNLSLLRDTKLVLYGYTQKIRPTVLGNITFESLYNSDQGSFTFQISKPLSRVMKWIKP